MTVDRRAKDLDTNVLVVAVVVAAVLSAVSLDRRTARQVWAEEGAGSLHCGGMQFGWVARMATTMSGIVTLQCVLDSLAGDLEVEKMLVFCTNVCHHI